MSEHGTASRYDLGCRCAPCIGAKTAQQFRSRRRAGARGALDPGLIPHGRISGYTHRQCRCPKCRKAMAVYAAARRARKRAEAGGVS